MPKHHSFKCRSCKAPLADVYVTVPDESIPWNFYAECCHCGDRSYSQTINGMFSIGASEHTARYTNVDGYDMESDPMVIKTVKVKQYV